MWDIEVAFPIGLVNGYFISFWVEQVHFCETAKKSLQQTLKLNLGQEPFFPRQLPFKCDSISITNKASCIFSGFGTIPVAHLSHFSRDLDRWRLRLFLSQTCQSITIISTGSIYFRWVFISGFGNCFLSQLESVMILYDRNNGNVVITFLSLCSSLIESIAGSTSAYLPSPSNMIKLQWARDISMGFEILDPLYSSEYTPCSTPRKVTLWKIRMGEES